MSFSRTKILSECGNINFAIETSLSWYVIRSYFFFQIASAKGLVAGAVTIIRSDGVTIDCQIPRTIPHADDIRKIESTADIVIVVEKEVVSAG